MHGADDDGAKELAGAARVGRVCHGGAGGLDEPAVRDDQHARGPQREEKRERLERADDNLQREREASCWEEKKRNGKRTEKGLRENKVRCAAG